MANISLRNIHKTYSGGIKAVSDFNLEIEDKEFIILVGPSGCGKSTLLRMVAGLEEITEGELYIGDKLVNGLEPKDRNIAMVFQSYALYPHMTVYKNMAFALKLRKTPKAEIDRKVHEVARMLDIESLLKRKPKHLSGGQRQRVALGRAMVRDPAVFLLDEPLSNLDAKLRTSTRTEITKLHKRLETTFIYVTHDQTEAMTMGDKIVVMNDGLIQQVDTPQKLYEHPRNKFVAGFIGTPQMNFLNVKIEKSKDGHVAKFKDFNLPVPPSRIRTESISRYEGREVTLGIRPESLEIASDAEGQPGYGIIEATVDIAEMMGSEIYLYAACDEDNIIARIPVQDNLDSGDKIKLALDCNRIHLFDDETGEVIV